MGKQPPKVDQNGRMKVRIIEFELEGSDVSLQESLKSITAALSKPAVIQAARSTQRLGTTKTTAEVENESEEQVEDLEPLEEVDYREEAVSVTSRISPKKPRRVSKVVTPNLVDIKFDDVTPKFADFVAQKNPKSNKLKYLCAAYWLMQYKEINEVSVDHVYTAYRVMGWALPDFPIQNMRELAATRDKRFQKGTGKGHYSITHVGVGFIETKMGNM